MCPNQRAETDSLRRCFVPPPLALTRSVWVGAQRLSRAGRKALTSMNDDDCGEAALVTARLAPRWANT